MESLIPIYTALKLTNVPKKDGMSQEIVVNKINELRNLIEQLDSKMANTNVYDYHTLMNKLYSTWAERMTTDSPVKSM